MTSDIDSVKNTTQLAEMKQLVENGKPIFGVFNRVEQINYLDYHSHLLSGKAVSQWRKKLRMNQFCFVQVVQPPYRICVAVATLNWVTSSFCYIYNQDTDVLELVEGLQPFTHNTEFNQSTYEGRVAFSGRKLTVVMAFAHNDMTLSIDSNIVKLQAHLQRPFKPLSVCTPTGKTGWTYTQKESIDQVGGEFSVNSSGMMSLSGATASLDWSAGYMRRITNWYWACVTSHLANGQHFGLNLATGVNESGASENACWLEGERYHLPAVLFRRGDDKESWHISNQPLNWSNVHIDLTFTPINCYKKSDRLIVVDSIFEQWIGYYSGTIVLGDEVITLDKVMGLAEDHYAKW